MQVPFLDLKIQYKSIKQEVDPAIQKVIDNTAFILGESVSNFEKAFAEAHNVKYCLGTSSGTDANHLVLWSLGIKSGDEVIIPANTFIATAWGVTLCGAKPVFVDCHPESYNLDPAKVEAAITPKTKAIVAVHLYGQPADMNKLQEIADRHNLFLVEDAAQSHLAEYESKKIGTLSSASSFSFYPGKNLGAYGEAGAVVTNDDNLYNVLKMMREHGQSKKYYHDTFGHNYRMEGIQGAVLGVKLKHLDKWTDGRRNAAAKYRELLKDIEQIQLPKEMSNVKHVYHLFVIQVKGDEKNREEERNKLQQFLTENGVATGLHYAIPLHQQKCFQDLGYKKGDFPVTEQLAESGLSLPMFPELTYEQISYVTDKIKEYFTK
ncbi:DegT/DnrJ/EryC1/StrS family aminotransferase [bacterium BMS3Abin03]|nr:DegT/DnrJ/EryC1/StrS family aminotransferase [bacterium BMS3Abin03]MCG6959101.1 DegT/DnrJ/EryC1/StrS family aminotransferase [bacterium BMS3Abin03]